MAERVVTFDEFARIVREMPEQAPRVARAVMGAAVQSMVRDVAKNRMSGQYLGVVTGTARRSIVGQLEGGGDSLRGIIGSPFGYVRAHELGFEGPVQVRSHTRRLNALQLGRRGKVTRSSAAAYKRAGGSGVAYVRAHRRQMRLRARHFLRDTIMQEAGQLPGLLAGGEAPLTLRIRRAMEILTMEGRLPKVAELGV